MTRLIARLVFGSDWPLDKILWHWLHCRVGTMVRWWGYEDGWHPGMRGSAFHRNERHWTVRLNNWVAPHWTHWWVQRSLERDR